MSETIRCKKCGHDNQIKCTATLDRFRCDDCGEWQNLKFVHKPGQFANEGSDPIPMNNNNKNDNGLPF